MIKGGRLARWLGLITAWLQIVKSVAFARNWFKVIAGLTAHAMKLECESVRFRKAAISVSQLRPCDAHEHPAVAYLDQREFEEQLASVDAWDDISGATAIRKEMARGTDS